MAKGLAFLGGLAKGAAGGYMEGRKMRQMEEERKEERAARQLQMQGLLFDYQQKLAEKMEQERIKAGLQGLRQRWDMIINDPSGAALMRNDDGSPAVKPELLDELVSIALEAATLDPHVGNTYETFIRIYAPKPKKQQDLSAEEVRENEKQVMVQRLLREAGYGDENPAPASAELETRRRVELAYSGKEDKEKEILPGDYPTRAEAMQDKSKLGPNVIFSKGYQESRARENMTRRKGMENPAVAAENMRQQIIRSGQEPRPAIQPQPAAQPRLFEPQSLEDYLNFDAQSFDEARQAATRARDKGYITQQEYNDHYQKFSEGFYDTAPDSVKARIDARRKPAPGTGF